MEGHETEGDVFDDFSDLIRDVLNEMGYNVEEQELQEIEKDLRLLEENADVVNPQLFSCLLDKSNDFSSFITYPEQSLQQLDDKKGTSASVQRTSQKQGNKVPREFDELITHGYMRLQEVYEGIKHYEKLIEGKKDDNGHKNRNISGEDVELESNSRFDQQQVAKETKQKVDGKENCRPVSMLGKLDPREETKLLNKFLKRNALRRTQCPEPGRLPFKHDQRMRMEQYRQEWAKNPPPGEQKRMALRWRIRELMTRREIPQLRILTTDYHGLDEDQEHQY